MNCKRHFQKMSSTELSTASSSEFDYHHYSIRPVPPTRKKRVTSILTVCYDIYWMAFFNFDELRSPHKWRLECPCSNIYLFLGYYCIIYTYTTRTKFCHFLENIKKKVKTIKFICIVLKCFKSKHYNFYYYDIMCIFL